MSPRLPRSAMSARRMTLVDISDVLVLVTVSADGLLERHHLGCDEIARRPLAAITAFAPAAATLGRHALRIGQQRHLPCVLDGGGDIALLLGVVAADPAGPDLGTVGHEPLQQVHIL